MSNNYNHNTYESTVTIIKSIEHNETFLPYCKRVTNWSFSWFSVDKGAAEGGGGDFGKKEEL